MKLLFRWFVSAVTLMLLAYYLPGVGVTGWGWAFFAALILGLVNALIRPILLIFTLPINIITLGLFTFVINALLFWSVGSIFRGFIVTGFWPAFWGALILSVVSWVISSLLKK